MSVNDDLLEIFPPAPPPPPRAKRARGRTRFPDAWIPAAAERAIADQVGMTCAERRDEWDQFADHHRAKGSLMADWPAAWRTWCRNWRKFNGARRPANNGGGFASFALRMGKDNE